MKRIIITALMLLLCIAMPLTAYANDIAGNVYEIDDRTIQFKSNSAFTEEEQLKIVNVLIEDENEIAPYNLVCSLFSHKYTSEIITTTTHNVRSSAPKCLLEKINVSVCSRCGYTEKEHISSSYINCHQ